MLCDLISFYQNRVHRVIVASGSRYLLELFSKYAPGDLDKIKVPQPFNQQHELHSDDQVSRILKYLYNKQVSIYFNLLKYAFLGYQIH